MISGRFINFKTRLKYSALGNIGRSCCFKRAERHHEEDLQKLSDGTGSRFENLALPAVGRGGGEGPVAAALGRPS